MRITNEETAAARQLADALIQLIVAVDEGATARRAVSRQEIAVRPERPKLEREQLLLTSIEAAKALSISTRLLWSMTAPRGPIPAIRVGGRAVRYAVADLKAAADDWRVRKRNPR